MKRHSRLLASVLLLAALGCGGGNQRFSITGTVTLDGKPLERGQIDFEPFDGKGPLAAAEIRDGKYFVDVMPGKKKVRVTGGKLIGQHRLTPDSRSPMVDDIKPLVPECYNEKSTLTREFESGQTVYDFELKAL